MPVRPMVHLVAFCLIASGCRHGSDGPLKPFMPSSRSPASPPLEPTPVARQAPPPESPLATALPTNPNSPILLPGSNPVIGEGPKLPPIRDVAAVPAALSRPPEPVPIEPASAVDLRYHATTDYSQLRGRLDRHARGEWMLRYRDAAEDDANGGKVHLKIEPIPANWHDGDWLEVEGTLDRENTTGDYPAYRVTRWKPLPAAKP